MKKTEDTAKTVDYGLFMLETGLDEVTVAELYRAFLEELLGEKEKLLRSYAENNLIMSGRIVHNIKGISGSYKVLPVFEKASSIDRKFKDAAWDGIGKMLEELASAMDNAAADIRKYMELHGGNNPQ